MLPIPREFGIDVDVDIGINFNDIAAILSQLTGTKPYITQEVRTTMVALA